MKTHPIKRVDLWLAEVVLFVAILLQIAIWLINPQLTYGPHSLIVGIEVGLALIIGFSAGRRHIFKTPLYRSLTFVLLALISAANVASFFLVARLLVINSQSLSGRELLVAALAIFITNIIVFALWYWELDSPGISGQKWSRNQRDFQFTQQDLPQDFSTWQPGFIDYLYLAVTNAVNFAPADARPLTPQAKALMGTQALLSVFTLALILARSVNVLH